MLFLNGSPSVSQLSEVRGRLSHYLSSHNKVRKLMQKFRFSSAFRYQVCRVLQIVLSVSLASTLRSSEAVPYYLASHNKVRKLKYKFRSSFAFRSQVCRVLQVVLSVSLAPTLRSSEALPYYLASHNK